MGESEIIKIGKEVIRMRQLGEKKERIRREMDPEVVKVMKKDSDRKDREFREKTKVEAHRIAQQMRKEGIL